MPGRHAGAEESTGSEDGDLFRNPRVRRILLSGKVFLGAALSATQLVMAVKFEDMSPSGREGLLWTVLVLIALDQVLSGLTVGESRAQSRHLRARLRSVHSPPFLVSSDPSLPFPASAHTP